MADEGIGSGNIVHETEDDNFVEVMFAKSMDEAADCRRLLQERSIPARVEVDSEIAKRCGIAVLVPADRLLEASELLASKAQDDDYEFEEEEEEEDEEKEVDDDEYEDDDYEDDDDDFEEEEDDL
jgi:hypothetical protein